MSEVKKTAKSALIYAIGIMLERAASFIMLPIYTRYLTPAHYGTIELLVMTMEVFGFFAHAGITMAVFRFYARQRSAKGRRAVISTAFVMLILSYSAFGALGFWGSGLLGQKVLSGTPEDTFFFRLIFLCFITTGLMGLGLVYFRIIEKPIHYVAYSLCKLVLQLGLNIYFIVGLGMKVEGVLYSTLASFLLVGVALTVHVFRKVGFVFSWFLLKRMFLFGAPFILTNIGEFVLTFSDRYFLKSYTNLTVVGIYALGYKLGFILLYMASQPILNVWEPRRFEVAKQKNAREIESRIFFYFSLLLISVALGLAIFALDFFRIMSDPEYWSAYEIVPFIMLAYVLQGWTFFAEFGIHLSGKTQHQAYGTLFAGAIPIVVLSFLLIPPLGALGAAMATVVAFFGRFIYIYIVSQRYYRMVLPWAKTFWMLGVASVMYIVSFLLQREALWQSILVNTLIYLVFVAILFWVPVFTKQEKQAMAGIIRHPIQFFRSLRQGEF